MFSLENIIMGYLLISLCTSTVIAIVGALLKKRFYFGSVGKIALLVAKGLAWPIILALLSVVLIGVILLLLSPIAIIAGLAIVITSFFVDNTIALCTLGLVLILVGFNLANTSNE